MLNGKRKAGEAASAGTSDKVVIRVLAAICVALALIAVSLALLYGRQSERLRCAQDRAEIGLVGRSEVCP
jgi:hypothetical protein